MAIIIKKATIKDSAQLLNLQQMNLLESDNFLADPDEWSPSLTAEKQAITDCRKNKNLYLTAWQDKQIVGSLLLNRGQYRKNQHAGKIEIFIRPEFRNQGIGRQLVEKLFSWAKKNKVRKIELEVWSNNRPAITFYKKLGFKQEGIRKKAYCLKNRHTDGILMSKWV